LQRETLGVLNDVIISETSDKHFEEVNSLEEQRESLMNKLTTLQQILDGQIDKFKQQVICH
jgi:hypothetical protein